MITKSAQQANYYAGMMHLYFACKSAMLHAFYVLVGAAIAVASTYNKVNSNRFCIKL